MFLYFLVKGKCLVQIDDHKKSYLTGCIKEGQYFGEIALLTKLNRTANVISMNYITLAKISYDDF